MPVHADGLCARDIGDGIVDEDAVGGLQAMAVEEQSSVNLAVKNRCDDSGT